MYNHTIANNNLLIAAIGIIATPIVATIITVAIIISVATVLVWAKVVK